MRNHVLGRMKFSFFSLVALAMLATAFSFTPIQVQPVEAGSYYGGKKSYRSSKRSYRNSYRSNTRRTNRTRSRSISGNRYYGRDSYYNRNITNRRSKRSSGGPYYVRHGHDRLKTKRRYRGKSLVIVIDKSSSDNHNGYQPCPDTPGCNYRPADRPGGPAIIKLGDPYLESSPKIITFEGSDE